MAKLFQKLLFLYGCMVPSYGSFMNCMFGQPEWSTRLLTDFLIRGRSYASYSDRSIIQKLVESILICSDSVSVTKTVGLLKFSKPVEINTVNICQLDREIRPKHCITFLYFAPISYYWKKILCSKSVFLYSCKICQLLYTAMLLWIARKLQIVDSDWFKQKRGKIT